MLNPLSRTTFCLQYLLPLLKWNQTLTQTLGLFASPYPVFSADPLVFPDKSVVLLARKFSHGLVGGPVVLECDRAVLEGRNQSAVDVLTRERIVSKRFKEIPQLPLIHWQTINLHLQDGASPAQNPSLVHSLSAGPSSLWPSGHSYFMLFPTLKSFPEKVVFSLLSGLPHFAGAAKK
jgi:hypothetical protein